MLVKGSILFAMATTTMPEAIAEWGAKPETSARSVLVTIFGDTVLPVTRSVWLSQLFALTEVFGFSARLVRTSMSRLAAEDWFMTERVGRQSRYVLTETAVGESLRAEARIYHSTPSDWSGAWSLVFLDEAGLDDDDYSRVVEHLTWYGFVHLGRGLLGSPTVGAGEVREACTALGLSRPLPIATANFDDLEGLVDAGFFSTGFDIPQIAQAYREFVDRYQPLDPPSDPLGAFAYRTMLVHDLRRIRLRFPDIPSQLLPHEWIGDHADAIASDLYAVLSRAAAPVLSEILDLEYPSAVPGRFDA